MIFYVEGYVGLGTVRQHVAKKIGNGGRGSAVLPNDLYVLGSAQLTAPIYLRAGPNSQTLANYLSSKLDNLPVGVVVEPLEQIAYDYWINLSRDLRENRPDVCAKAIIMAYLACNNFIQWTQPLPHGGHP